MGGKLKSFAQGREGLDFNDLAAWRDKGDKLIWFHCASLGEFEQGRPVLEEFKVRHPEYLILLTFFSPSGYDIRKNYAHADKVVYLPIDRASNARRFVQAVRPNKVVFVKYEFWPNVIREIKNFGAHLIGISVILRESQAFFKSYGGFFRETLNNFDFLFVQNPVSGSLLDSIHYTQYQIVGDTRFDRVLATAEGNTEVKGIADFVQGYPTMVIGSAWQEDLEVLKPFILKNKEMRFIIAPHEIKPHQINTWKNELGAELYSEIGEEIGTHVLLVDSIGLLSKLYAYADYAWVGGAYKSGLHNILEAGVFGVPVFFGDKKYHKFQEAVDLIQVGVAFPIKETLDGVLEGIDKELVKNHAHQYVQQNIGATGKILAYLENN